MSKRWLEIGENIAHITTVVPGMILVLATMLRLTHHRAKAGSILRTPRSKHRATQPTVPRLSS